MTDRIDSNILWDVIVIGTGMGGATVGFSLASQGFRVLFLEKGPEDVKAVDGEQAESPAQRLTEGYWPERIIARIDNVTEEIFPPLGCAAGGSTLFYAAALERFERLDFEPLPGLEHPTGGWPVSYDVMLRYYERAERLYCVRGTSDPLGELVDLLPPATASAQDELLMHEFKRAGLHPYRLHVGISYQPGCRECLGRPCPTGCKSTARSICLDPAVQYYNAKLLTDSEVTRLLAVGSRITAVEFRHCNATTLARGRIVILSAGSYRSPALLLNSACPEWPDGLANASGLVGRNLMFHGGELIAVWPRQRGSSDGPRKTIGIRDFYSYNGLRLGSLQSLGVSAGYGNILVFLYTWFDASPIRRFRLLRPFLRIPALVASKLFGSATIFALIVEDFGEPENRVVLDPERPGRIQVRYRLNDELRHRMMLVKRLLRDRLRGFRMMTLQADMTVNFGHPTGTCRFGHNPASSVLDANCRSHEISNLYVVDGSFMPSCGGTNPALTIAANALRVGDVIGGRLRDGQI
jgi:choline dehydrogenase-like flavoprotein